MLSGCGLIFVVLWRRVYSTAINLISTSLIKAQNDIAMPGHDVSKHVSWRPIFLLIFKHLNISVDTFSNDMKCSRHHSFGVSASVRLVLSYT